MHLLVRRVVIVTAMSVAIPSQHEEDIRTYKMSFALSKSVALLILRKRYNPFANKRGANYQGIGYVVREEARESAGALGIPAILDGCTLQQEVEDTAVWRGCQPFET